MSAALLRVVVEFHDHHMRRDVEHGRNAALPFWDSDFHTISFVKKRLNLGSWARRISGTTSGCRADRAHAVLCARTDGIRTRRPDRLQTARPSYPDLVLHLAVALFRRLVAWFRSCSSLAELSLNIQPNG